MSKPLVERLRVWAEADGANIWDESADRIEELEAKRQETRDLMNQLIGALKTMRGKTIPVNDVLKALGGDDGTG